MPDRFLVWDGSLSRIRFKNERLPELLIVGIPSNNAPEICNLHS